MCSLSLAIVDVNFLSVEMNKEIVIQEVHHLNEMVVLWVFNPPRLRACFDKNIIRRIIIQNLIDVYVVLSFGTIQHADTIKVVNKRGQ